jgi:hypothetical protein
MTHVEVSYQMGFILKVVRLHLEKFGCAYPLVITLNKGSGIHMNVNADVVLDQKMYVVRRGELIDLEGAEDPTFVPTLDDVYVTILMFKLRSKEDEKLTLKLFKALAQQYKPDAIAYVNSCMYNEYDNPKSISDEAVISNPDSVRVIHCCYYIDGDPQVSMCVLPFLNRGELSTEIPSIEDMDRDEEDIPDKQYDIFVSDCGWFTAYSKLDPFVKYPY